jgi:hypothetical protein
VTPSDWARSTMACHLVSIAKNMPRTRDDRLSLLIQAVGHEDSDDEEASARWKTVGP